MASHDLQSSRRIWTEYWHSGRQGCLTDETPVAAQDHIRNLWNAWFGEQPPGARIIDLACGAGSVARTALNVGCNANRQFEIEGVDLAELGTDETAVASGGGTTMRLRGGIDLTCLPFPDRSFDCAVSQFGIEYADSDTACCELARVVKPKARGLFLLHHAKSAISGAASARLDALAAVLGNGEIVNRAKDVYAAMAARSPESLVSARLLEFRQRLRVAIAAHSAGFSWETNLREILDFLSDLARDPRIYDPADALHRLTVAQETIAAWISRQQLQLSAARDEDGMRDFSDTIRRHRFEPGAIGIVNDPASGAIIAWRLEFATRELP